MIRARPARFPVGHVARRLTLWAAIAASVCGPAAGARTEEREVARKANPSAVFAAELALARTAQEQGQWTAFAAAATRDAVLFVPQAVLAQQWLKGRANPAQPMRWRVHRVWSSCDGTLAAATGSAQLPGGAPGTFTSLWQRRKNGSYALLLNASAPLPAAMAEPEAVTAIVADCPTGRGAGPRGNAVAPPARIALPGSGGGAALDQSLSFEWTVGSDLARTLRVTMTRDGQQVPVLDIADAGGTLAQ